MPSLDDIVSLLRDEKLDVLCVTETWLQDSVMDNYLVFPGYSIARLDRSARGGGVAIIYRDYYRIERLIVPSAGSSLECLWVTVCMGRSFTVGVAYRPPNGPIAPALDDLEHQLVHILETGKNLYLLGDLNFDQLSPTKPGVQQYTQLLQDLRLKQLIDLPTRSGSLLDHIIIKMSDVATSAQVIRCSLSDHDLIIADVPVTRCRRRPSTVTVRSTHRLNIDALCYDLLTADWGAIYEATAVSDKWSAWLSVWSPHIDHHMPLVKIKSRHRPCPWLNDERVRDTMRARDEARAEWDRNPCSETREKYRECRNITKRAQYGARAMYFESTLQHSMTTTWKDIRRFMISKKSKQVPPSTEQVSELADRLNAHFSTVGQTVAAAAAAQQTGAPPLSPRPPRVCSAAFRVTPATLPELSQALRNMSNSKASGEDGITLSMLRQTFPVIGPHLLHVINASIVSGTVPSEWKLAIITPLHKSGCRSDPNNYRPISILPTVAKLAERVVCNQLIKYLSDNFVLCEQQHGFRPGHSTETAMLDSVMYLSESIDKGQIATLTTIDTSKAFDSVEHGRLLEKLGWYGVDQHWFQNWLCDRRQRVRDGSDVLPLTHGVIQGSILGPVLFLLFTNDFSSHATGCKIVMYADDVQFIHTAHPSALHELKHRIEKSLSIADSWFSQNSLKINPTKTDFMFVHTRQRRSVGSFSVDFGTSSIQASQSVKVLGVTMDKNLSWEPQVSSVIKRCYACICGLSKFSQKLSKNVKKKLIEALVFPHLQYCLTVWGSCNIAQRYRIQKIINHCARIVTGARRYDHVSPLLAELEWSKFDELLHQRDLAMLNKIMLSPYSSTSLKKCFRYRRSVSCRITRGAVGRSLELPRVHTETARRSFAFRAVSVWNRTRTARC